MLWNRGIAQDDSHEDHQAYNEIPLPRLKDEDAGAFCQQAKPFDVPLSNFGKAETIRCRRQQNTDYSSRIAPPHRIDINQW